MSSIAGITQLRFVTGI